jgi:hypothetical protein
VVGGSPSAYHPYSATITTTAILLPLNPENHQPTEGD